MLRKHPPAVSGASELVKWLILHKNALSTESLWRSRQISYRCHWPPVTYLTCFFFNGIDCTWDVLYLGFWTRYWAEIYVPVLFWTRSVHGANCKKIRNTQNIPLPFKVLGHQIHRALNRLPVGRLFLDAARRPLDDFSRPRRPPGGQGEDRWAPAEVSARSWGPQGPRGTSKKWTSGLMRFVAIWYSATEWQAAYHR